MNKYLLIFLVALVLTIAALQAVADEWVVTGGGGYLPDHPKGITVGVRKNWDRKYYTADVLCYDKCRPSVGFGWYLIKDRPLLLGSTYYLSWGPQLRASTRMVGTVYAFTTRAGINFGPVALEVKHSSNAAALLGHIFGEVVMKNQGDNSLNLTYRREI